MLSDFDKLREIIQPVGQSRSSAYVEGAKTRHFKQRVHVLLLDWEKEKLKCFLLVVERDSKRTEVCILWIS